MAVDVGEVQGGGGIGGFSRRQLLIGALVIGGGIGAIVLISRMNASKGTGSQTDESQPQDTSTLGIAYQNLATQLLGLRGDLSVANADLASGQQDLLSQVAQESVNRASANDNLLAMLASYFSGLGGQVAAVQSGVTEAQTSIGRLEGETTGGLSQISGAIGGTQAQLAAIGQTQSANSATLNQIAVRQYYGNQYDPTNGGAGGALVRDSILAAFDGGLGSGDEALSRLSAGPVRVLRMDRRN